MAETRRIAVVGAGISGLAAAVELLDNGHSVVLYDEADRAGGRIDSIVLDGLTVPTAADNFVARTPQVAMLAERVGLDHDLLAPEARQARIARGGALYELPPTLLGVPTDLGALRPGLISRAGLDRARLDLDLPDDRPACDESVGDLVRRRLGDEILEYLVDPLLGGINAGDSDRLSLEAGVPQLAHARSLDHRLTIAAGELRERTIDPETSVFLGLAGGLNRLVEELRKTVDDHPDGEVELGFAVRSIERSSPGWTVSGTDFDQVVLATPAAATAELLEPVVPAASALLRSIEYSSVAVVLLVVPRGSIAQPRSVSGVLVPRAEGHLITAISFASHKWPDVGSAELDVLRISVGRRSDRRWVDMSDDELTTAVIDDAGQILGQPVEPVAHHVHRWLDALPQYDVGHGDRVRAVEEAVGASGPGLHLAGAWMHGLGLAACAQSGLDAARAIGS